MKTQYKPLNDRLHGLAGKLRRDRLPFITAMLVGLLSHGYAFTNKLVNHDEIESLFGKGATVTSGRWGLEAVKLLFPDWSMPWLYGILSLMLISAAVCLIMRILNVRYKIFQGLLAALIISFPSLTGNFCFMFTSSAYAWAFLLSVLSVYEFRKGGALRIAVSIVSLVLCLGIYQAYIAVAASLYVLCMISYAMDGFMPVKRVIMFGLRALTAMLVSVGIYYAVTQAVFAFTGAEFNTYVTENVTADAGLPRRIRMAYDAFFYVFSFRNFYLISTEFSRYVHIVLAAVILMSAGAAAFRMKKPLNAALMFFLICLLPLSICCMFLIMSQESIHTLVLYSFTAVYMLAVLVTERLLDTPGAVVRDFSSLLMTLIICANVCFANMVYLKLQLQYESAYSFYTSLSAQIKNTEGFDENSRLALIGKQDNMLYTYPQLDTELLMGVSRDLVNVYSQERFIRYYIGFDIPFADADEISEIEQSESFKDMPEYPYYGSVGKIGDCIVVKLG